MQTQNLLDFSDFESNEDDLKHERIELKRILDIIDLISCSSLYPNVSFEITPLDKLKIAATSLSQILINKPKQPDEKLRNISSGYLCLDPDGRLMPISSSNCMNRSIVGVWVYGADMPAYQVQSTDSNTVRAREVSMRTNKEEFITN